MITEYESRTVVGVILADRMFLTVSAVRRLTTRWLSRDCCDREIDGVSQSV